MAKPKPTTDAEAFEASLRANPDDLAGWCAYADYLTEQGDPRGEFMQTQLALEDESRPKAERAALKKREAELLAAHEREWLGPLVAFTLDAKPVTYWTGTHRGEGPPVIHAFARGWLNRLEFVRLTVEQARALVNAPEARLLRELVVAGVESENPVGQTDRYIDSYYEPGPDVPVGIASYDDPALHPLSRFPYFAGLGVFQLGGGNLGLHGEKEDVDQCHTNGELALGFVRKMPRLEELHLLARGADAGKVCALPMPNLRVLSDCPISGRHATL